LAPLPILPANACDCHVHVFGPASRYPFAPERTYTPPEASVEDLLALQERLGLERVVIVHPSPYGTDNSCTVDAVRRLGNRARGVAVIDARSPLDELHEAGIRGVRLNLETGGVRDSSVAQRMLDETARRVAPLGWHVQLFASMELLKPLRLPIRVVVDHFGLPRNDDDLDFLIQKKVFVKLSAPHRVPMDPGRAARALVAAMPERCLWGSDWPHPFTRGARKRDEVQPFDAIDDADALRRFHGWVGDEALFRKILVDNPARLYDFAP